VKRIPEDKSEQPAENRISYPWEKDFGIRGFLLFRSSTQDGQYMTKQTIIALLQGFPAEIKNCQLHAGGEANYN
jgi:hypothetical protein